MAGCVKLEVVRGPLAPRVFSFEQPDTLIFGRAPDCHVPLPTRDDTVSRYHFLLEVNPPDARLRDLGSLNGTYVNGTRYGGSRDGPRQRKPGEEHEALLGDGDVIRVGATTFRVHVDTGAFCGQCGGSISPNVKTASPGGGASLTCPTCGASDNDLLSTSPRFSRCTECDADASAEIGGGRPGTFVCRACRGKIEQDPNSLLDRLTRERGDGARAPDSSLLQGYEITGMLGTGRMGAVYRARRGSDGREVALKVLTPKVAVDAYLRKTFEREIDVCRTLRHPNIVEVIDHGAVGGVFFSVMELCGGGNLRDLMTLRGGKVPLRETTDIILQVLEGLAFAHERGFVHRDLKPANLLLTAARNPVAKIADFGLAKSFIEIGLNSFTITGQAGGTFDFMPREQLIHFKYVKPVSDVWSIGATMYFLLTGEFPRDRASDRDPVDRVLSESVVPIRERDSSIPEPVGQVIDRALAIDVKERYPTAAEFRDDLSTCLERSS